MWIIRQCTKISKPISNPDNFIGEPPQITIITKSPITKSPITNLNSLHHHQHPLPNHHKSTPISPFQTTISSPPVLHPLCQQSILTQFHSCKQSTKPSNQLTISIDQSNPAISPPSPCFTAPFRPSPQSTSQTPPFYSTVTMTTQSQSSAVDFHHRFHQIHRPILTCSLPNSIHKINPPSSQNQPVAFTHSHKL